MMTVHQLALFMAFIVLFAWPEQADADRARGSDIYTVKPPIVTPPRMPARRYYLEFRARYGPGSITGHLNIRTFALLHSGKYQLTSLFGLYADGGKENYVASVVGTAGKVGYTYNDLRVRPVERYRLAISEKDHSRILRAAYALARKEKWFELFQTNCNYLAARVARMIGLRAPGNVAQYPDVYLHQLKLLNRRR